MEKYYIGYKQGNGEYVYVSSINNVSIGVALDFTNAIDFVSEEIARDISEYLNLRESSKQYVPLLVKIDIKEVTE